jgi:hypothetical protein
MLPAAALFIVSNADHLYGPARRIVPAAAAPAPAPARLAAQPDVAIRRARPADARRLADLAQLDSSRPITGDALVAEIDGTPEAALELSTGRVVADPFVRTAEAVGLMSFRAEQLHAPARHTARRRTRPLAAVAGLLR